MDTEKEPSYLDSIRQEYLRSLMAEAKERYPELPGLEPGEESLDQLRVLEVALIVHCSRTSSYGTVWRKWGALSPLLSAAKKMDRLMECFWFKRQAPTVAGKPAVDDAVDAINYLAFFIRLQENQ